MIVSRVSEARRRWAVLLLVLTAAVLHAIWSAVFVVLGLWFLLGVGVGLLLGRWWALLASPIPWLLGLSVGFATGRYLYLGEYWQVIAAISSAVGLAGVTVGLLARLIIRNGRSPVPPRAERER